MVIFGALLPMPTEQYDHWFGLDAYTISPSGQQLLLRALKFNRPGLKPFPESANVCGSRRTIVIRLPRGMRRAKVLMNGKRQKVLRGRRLRARIDLRRSPKGAYTVRIVGRDRHGRIMRGTRSFRTCTRRGAP